MAPVTATSDTTALAGLGVPNDARTTLGTISASVTLIGDGTPTAAPSVGAATGLAGHTRIALDATVTAIRRRVGATTNTKLTSAPLSGVTANVPAVTLDESELSAVLDELTRTDDGTTVSPTASANATGTVFCDPATSVTPSATVPSVAVAASTATSIAADASGCVYPSGPVTTTANLTEDGATVVALAVAVYRSIVTVPRAASYAYVGVVPYCAPVAASTTLTCATVEFGTSVSLSVSVSTIGHLLSAPHTRAAASISVP